MARFAEVAPRVWVARYDWLDVNVTAIGSDRGLVVVDTHSSGLAAAGVVVDLRRLAAGEVVAVVNTHCHFDHTFGNATFRAEYGDVPVHAHRTPPRPRDRPESGSRATTATTPTTRIGTRSSRRCWSRRTGRSPPRPPSIFGDRVVELLHPGRGHTDGDLVVRIPDVDVLLAGDLVEESAAPAYGRDCFPLDWPHSMDVVLGLTTSASVLVPGHRAPLGRAFVEVQRTDLGLVADAIRTLAGAGALDGALDAGAFPFPPTASATRCGVATSSSVAPPRRTGPRGAIPGPRPG